MLGRWGVGESVWVWTQTRRCGNVARTPAREVQGVVTGWKMAFVAGARELGGFGSILLRWATPTPRMDTGRTLATAVRTVCGCVMAVTETTQGQWLEVLTVDMMAVVEAAAVAVTVRRENRTQRLKQVLGSSAF